MAKFALASLSEAEKLSFGLYLEQGVHILGNFLKHNDSLPRKLVGLEQAEAEEELARIGLRLLPGEEVFDETVERCLEHGGHPLRAPGPMVWGGYAATLRDPDGHVWEVVRGAGQD